MNLDNIAIDKCERCYSREPTHVLQLTWDNPNLGVDLLGRCDKCTRISPFDGCDCKVITLEEARLLVIKALL